MYQLNSHLLLSPPVDYDIKCYSNIPSYEMQIRSFTTKAANISRYLRIYERTTWTLRPEFLIGVSCL